jgi:outer membrane protein TolC
MRRFQVPLTWLCAFILLACSLSAQNEIRIEAPKSRFGWLTRPYQARIIPPINLSNTSRLESLIRAGNLYLSAQDVVALAIENNIDVEVQRYGPLLAQEVLRRAQAGGALRNVGLGIAPGAQSVSLQGVSLNTGGIAATAGGNNAGGGIVTQLGPALVQLDPSLLFLASFQHATSPQSNTVLTGTTAEVVNTKTYEAQYTQSWLWGMTATGTYLSNYTHVNSQLFTLNPFTSGYLDLTVTQNLLQGFGSAVNGRNIRVQRNNLKVTDLQFKQQVITTVASVLNLYWDLVAFDEEVRSRKAEVETARQLFEDNKKQVSIGALAEIEITRAEAQLYTSQQDLTIAQTNLLQQETVLKNALSRNGVASPTLANVHIIPLDKLVIPPADELKPVDDLVADALGKRVELEQDRINIDSKKLDLAGVKSSLRPTLQAFAELTNNGLTGQLLQAGVPGAAYFAGGYDNLLGQIFRRNFPNYSAGLSLNIPLRNRAAQADYVTNMIDIRQNELSLQKSANQVRVDVSNAVIGLKQARVRFDSAVKARVLQQQTYNADQRKYALGASTVYQVVQDQRDLASAQSSEVQAMANYSHARIALDQAIGDTLEVNHISLQEALVGKVARPSELPANLPEEKQ